MAHGDMLFFRDPDNMPDDTAEDIRRLLRSAFLALNYEYVDHAAAILTRPGVAKYLADNYNFDTMAALSQVSHTLRRRYRRAQWRKRWIAFKGVVGRAIGAID